MKRSLAAVGAAATITLAGLTGCSTGPSDAAGEANPDVATTADPNAFPVTIEHAFGETTVEEEPQRVATLGWTDHDNALALGVVPVGATKLTWGGNEAGSSDWFDAALEDQGGDAPVRYDDSDGAPVEEVAKLAPDLILATNSGLTEKEYKKLSKIAPVVAYPEAPWVTPWQVSLETVGEALGRSDLAAQLTEETEEKIAAAGEEYPEIAGSSVVFAYLTTTDLSTIGIYGRGDPRVSLLEDFGMKSPAIVDESVEDGQFYGQVSAEQASKVESDVLLTYGETDKDLQTYSEDKLLGQIPAIKSGAAYAEVDKHVGLAITNPTPLSIPYTIDNFLPHVNEAASAS